MSGQVSVGKLKSRLKRVLHLRQNEPICDPGTLPDLIWREHLIKTLDAVDLFHLSQTSADCCRLMWKLVPKTLKDPQYYNKRLNITLSNASNAYMWEINLNFSPVTPPGRGPSAAVATQSSGKSKVAHFGVVPRGVTKSYSDNQRTSLLAYMHNISSFSFEEVTITIAFRAETLRDIGAIDTVKKILQYIRCKTPIRFVCGKFERGNPSTELFPLAIDLSEEILTIPITYLVKRAYSIHTLCLSSPPHRDVQEHFMKKMRELGDECIYKQIKVDASVCNEARRWRTTLTMGIKAAEKDPSLLVLSYK